MTDAELIKRIDDSIAELVVEKHLLVKAYQYYNGEISSEQYKYLEENFGIGTPTSIEFIPLLKKHVDSLVGEYLEMPIIKNISFKDKNTVSKIDREKQLKVTKATLDAFKNALSNNLYNLITGKKAPDSNIKDYLENIKEKADKDFISEFSIAAQNVLDYCIQSEDIDLVDKRRLLYLNFLITGESYYKTKTSKNGSDITLEVLDPLNTFIDINKSNPKVKKAQRAVVRRWMPYYQVLHEYGEFLSKDDIEKLKDNWMDSTYTYRDGFWVGHTTVDSEGYPIHWGIRASETFYAYGTYEGDSIFTNRFIPVYEVEMLETIKQKDGSYKVERFSEVRIGTDIYILSDEDPTVQRTISDPNNATLSINGIYFANHSNKPYSLILACSILQDKYNLLWFYRDTIIANSGTTGERIDISKIPEELGGDLAERLVKWKAYKKGGMALYKTENSEGPVQNTIVGDYDDTLKANSIQAIDYAMKSIEETCSSITGVFRERLNGIQQYDAVRNVQAGAKNSYFVTKQYFQQMDLLTRDILLDLLNIAKYAFKKGLKGTLTLGDYGVRCFTALPEYYTLTDHDIHILNASEASKALEEVRELTMEFVRSGQVTADIIVEVLGCNSITEYKEKLNRALNIKGKIDQQMQQYQKQLSDAENQIKQYQGQLQKLQQQIDAQKQAELQLKQTEMELRNKLEWFKANTDKSYKDGKLKVEDKKADIELKQLYDGNPYNDKVKMQ